MELKILRLAKNRMLLTEKRDKQPKIRLKVRGFIKKKKKKVCQERVIRRS